MAGGSQQLLDDFHENRLPNLQLTDICGHVTRFSMNHDGSKFIIRKLDCASGDCIKTIFEEIRSNLEILMVNKYGYAVVEKIFDVCTLEQRFELIQAIQMKFIRLSTHKYGCRLVQSAIANTKRTTLFSFMMTGPRIDFVRLAYTEYGHNVVKLCLRCLNTDNLQVYFFFFLLELINTHIFVILNSHYIFADN